jgi:hypothetical protein
LPIQWAPEPSSSILDALECATLPAIFRASIFH